MDELSFQMINLKDLWQAILLGIINGFLKEMKKRMVLLKQDKFITVLLLLCLVSACQNEKMEWRQRKVLYKNHSIQQIGIEEYNMVYNAAKDSLKNWTNNHLNAYTLYEDNRWFLDNLVCFNKEKDRCIMALSYQLDCSSDHDGMEWFYGAKIKGKWYFFRGEGSFTFLADFM